MIAQLLGNLNESEWNALIDALTEAGLIVTVGDAKRKDYFKRQRDLARGKLRKIYSFLAKTKLEDFDLILSTYTKELHAQVEAQNIATGKPPQPH